MAYTGSTLAGTVWESQRLSRRDEQYVVRVVRKGTPLSSPAPEVAASGGLAGLVAVVVSRLVRTLGRVVGRHTFRVCVVQLVPADSRSFEERIVSVVDVRGEREALEQARKLAESEL
ncbi:hypothetical protein LRP67_03290 [Nocardioides sp. cx-169]|uniref:hypothetical protein n=1 Tax=Nocardioides sp. cx-169 TaxID=2899080 RepID=UPI001E2E16BB|nr:hypothetical protein [Nocardioides sp. cx-169]MCD4533104.1 hypothetical protein [Nocardioides sp. cx-169]